VLNKTPCSQNCSSGGRDNNIRKSVTEIEISRLFQTSQSLLGKDTYIYMHTHIQFFVFEMGSCYIAQAGPKLLGSSEPLASASEVAGTTDAHHVDSISKLTFLQVANF
jgi:hypothetical protein